MHSDSDDAQWQAVFSDDLNAQLDELTHLTKKKDFLHIDIRKLQAEIDFVRQQQLGIHASTNYHIKRAKLSVRHRQKCKRLLTQELAKLKVNKGISCSHYD